jgi:hypothetical protein
LVRSRPVALPKYLPDSRPGRGRAVGDDADAVGLGHRQDLDLGLALHQAVHRLGDLQARPVVPLLEIDRALGLPRRPVADRGVDHLARAHQVLEPAHRFLDRRQRVVAMQEQHIDAIGLQPLEAGLDRLDDMAPRGAACVEVGADLGVDLGGEHKVVAMALHQPAEDLLRNALVVLVGGVEEVDAGVAAGFVHRRGGHLVGVAAERHGAEAELGNLDAGAAE